MLKLHQIIRPVIPSNFFEDTVDWWLGLSSGHLGEQMYQQHKGKRSGQPMSGVLTWAEHARYGTIPRQSQHAFSSHLDAVIKEVGKGLPIVEFGPGSMKDAEHLIRAVESREYIPVDCSLGIIKQASMLSAKVEKCSIRPAVIDFFSDENCPLTDRPALGVFLGLTISNIPGPVPSGEPRSQLVAAFENLAKTIPAGGALLVSTDVSQDGERNKALYDEPWQKLFGVNHLYRMAEELPMRNFDPEGFEYAAVWHEHCSLIAHSVLATKDQDFQMGENGDIRISVKKGHHFHYNNSFKYRPAFFEACAKEAGLDIIQCWQEPGSTIRLYLFQVPPQNKRQAFQVPSSLPVLPNVSYARCLNVRQQPVRKRISG